ncbi:hypothetical protein C8R44DRAFT_233014 [Mycena epipterygia]|nr:hypothetical protein C8R44DRAFT_233014 [Mycena epipterygia]
MSIMYLNCDGCAKTIRATAPRVHCLDCNDYDLCLDCAVGECFGGAHTFAHRISVFKVSGGGSEVPVPSSTKIVYAVAPPLPVRPRAAAEPTPTGPPQGWGPFFGEDMGPTPVFVQLMGGILAHLDTGGTGHLVPEAYSRFLDDLGGYIGDGNVWKASRTTRGGKTAEDVADTELKRVLDLFSIEYILRPRPRGDHTDDLAGAMAGVSISGGTMPMMTLKGFMDITTIEMLCDPSTEWGSISRVMTMYNLPAVRGWGPVPRSVLPEDADPRMKSRVARATAVSREEGQRMLEAARVKAMFQAQGSQNVLDLFDDRRYYYTYR